MELLQMLYIFILVPQLSAIIDKPVEEGQTVTFNCSLEHNEGWSINEKLYETADIPLSFPSIVVNSYSLTITNASLDINSTIFQCVTSHKYGTATRLIIKPTESKAELYFLYQNTYLDQDFVRLEWSNCSNRYELKAYNQSDINNEPCYYNITNYTSAEIPLSELTDTCGSKFLFRLVAVDNTCSNEDYYGFESKLNTTVLEPSSPKCYDIPDNASNLIYPNVNYSDQFCSCPVNKSNEEPYNDCAMCNLDFKPQFNSGKLCYSNLKFNMNETIIHFDSDTEYENKFIVQLIESHRIIISGPPNIPEATFNGTFLCVSAYAHAEFPVEYFDVKVMDITGIATNLSGKPTNGTLCQLITSNLSTPNVCLPFHGLVSATNSIGSSELLNFSSNTTDQDCSCYVEREQIAITVIDTITITLSCIPDKTNKTFELQPNNGQESTINFTLMCGDSIDLDNFTQYKLLRKYSDEILCEVYPSNSTNNKNTLIISTSVGVAGGFLLLLLLICIACYICHKKCMKRENNDPIILVADETTPLNPDRVPR